MLLESVRGGVEEFHRSLSQTLCVHVYRYMLLESVGRSLDEFHLCQIVCVYIDICLCVPLFIKICYN